MKNISKTSWDKIFKTDDTSDHEDHAIFNDILSY